MGARPTLPTTPTRSRAFRKLTMPPVVRGIGDEVGSRHIAGILLNYGAPGNCPAGRTAPAASCRYHAITHRARGFAVRPGGRTPFRARVRSVAAYRGGPSRRVTRASGVAAGTKLRPVVAVIVIQREFPITSQAGSSGRARIPAPPFSQ